MLQVSMRTFPGLFVGRRTLVEAQDSVADGATAKFVCGACDDVIFTAQDRSMLADLVVKCRCGEFNQI
ncbi:hypothetical protein [Phenylobacterium sp. J367]|uniref:hypothetical protein n=1 Tax=Phenylobacterium sp. J367 TaxID=2898435 RepID=UPI0021514D3E|nr:hypothetical protein [Phenylobacterium sp. J367]MCR5878648.1 hypothetical protein [Phenylobacterium sp. J367]